MSVDGTCTVEWAGEERTFRLAIGEMRQLFELVNRPRLAIGAPVIGPMSLLTSLQRGDAWPSEVREIIRLGLVGAGMKNDRALVLIKELVEPPGHLLSASVVAAAIMMSALTGSEDEPVGKPAAGGNGAEMPTGSHSPHSTEPGLQ